MGKRLERFVKVGIVVETNGFGLDFVKKTECVLEHHSRCGSSTLKKDGFGIYS